MTKTIFPPEVADAVKLFQSASVNVGTSYLFILECESRGLQDAASWARTNPDAFAQGLQFGYDVPLKWVPARPTPDAPTRTPRTRRSRP